MRKFAIAAAIGLVAMFLVATPADAKSPHTVDPLTMTPALNPQFNPWTCFEAGTGITCQGQFDSTYQNEPIDISCDGQPVYVTGSGHEQMTRWHNADGLAVRTIVSLSYPADVFSLSPTGGGPTVTVRGHWQRHYVYEVPGDISHRVLSEIGAIYMVNVGGQGSVIHDAGTVTYAPGQDFDVVASAHGIHDVLEPGFFESTICGLLT